VAVLAGLYVVKPWQQLLSELTPQQQVLAAVLADMWQLPAVIEAAVGLLQAAVDSTDSAAKDKCADKASAVLGGLLSLAAVPTCLLPLFEEALLGKFGNLEAVWDATAGLLQELLLQLPLHAMELLLASDKLKVCASQTLLSSQVQQLTLRCAAAVLRLGMFAQEVHITLCFADRRLYLVKKPVLDFFVCMQVASEDTVTYTAQAYVKSLAAESDKAQLAGEKLAPLVRCPHLSHFWLSASVLSVDADKLLLRSLQPQLKQLLLLWPPRPTKCPGRTYFSPEVLKEHIPAAPDSWLLPVRDIVPVGAVIVEWKVDVAAIRQTALDSVSQKQCVLLSTRSPKCLLGGIMWNMALQVIWDSSRQGITLGLFCCPETLPTGSYCCCTFSFERVDAPAIGPTTHKCYLHERSRGIPDFFNLGVLLGGFDEAAWAAKGLPTSGSILLRLTVKNVGI
jgi:hypothetical protein